MVPVVAAVLTMYCRDNEVPLHGNEQHSEHNVIDLAVVEPWSDSEVSSSETYVEKVRMSGEATLLPVVRAQI